jgi:hypothetical protein
MAKFENANVVTHRLIFVLDIPPGGSILSLPCILKRYSKRTRGLPNNLDIFIWLKMSAQKKDPDSD